MHTRTFDTKDGPVTVAFNSDFSGMAAVRWGNAFTGRCVEIPAVVLTVGIADIADGLFALAEKAGTLKDQAAEYTWKYTAEDWQEHDRHVQSQPVLLGGS